VCADDSKLAAADRAELLTVLATDPDEEIADRASGMLFDQPVEAFVEALSRSDADHRLFEYCADTLGDMPGIADALARNAAAPVEALTPLAGLMSSNGIQSLLDNLDRLSSDEALGVALADSKAATKDQQELLQEIKADAPIATKELAEAAEIAEPDVKKRETLLQKMAKMNIVQRMQRAVKGGREERLFLIKDPNKIVQRAVLQSPRLTDLEVESFSAMANVSTEVLRIISMNRVFMKSYVVAKNLTKNPKTPLDISLHLLPRLTPQDLKFLCGNKNVPETLRSTAMKLHRSRNTKPASE
jgi:predicted transcriptional regulator